MTTAVIYSSAPITMNATTLAVSNLQLPHEVAVDGFRHSGNEFASVLAVSGAAPRVRFSTPFAAAYTLIGLKALKLTTCNIYLSKFSDGLKLATSTHRKWALTSSCTALACIRGASVSNRGLLMADVEIVFLSNDGQAHPLTASDANALPTLGSEPALHTLGPATINGTTTGGYLSCSLDLGAEITVALSDGDRFPRVAAYVGGTPIISCEHTDPVTLSTVTGLTGVALSSNFVQYFRTYDTSTHLSGTDGLSLTVASGRVVLDTIGSDNLAVATGSLRVLPLSTSTTHPIVVASGATVPSP